LCLGLYGLAKRPGDAPSDLKLQWLSVVYPGQRRFELAPGITALPAETPNW
jgi:hypothetical protein